MRSSDKSDILGSGGGGKGGGKSHTPREDKDSLRSKATVRILDLVSEGEIEGLVDGLKTVYLNDTPVQNTNGSFNYDIVFDERAGLPDQPYMEGFPAVESEHVLNQSVTTSVNGTYTATSADVDAIRVTIQLPQGLSRYTDKGDHLGTSVALAIDRQLGSGPWQEVHSFTIRGMARSAYEKSFRVPRPSAAGVWGIRVRRLTSDSTTSRTINATALSRVTELLDVKLQYNYSAYFGVAADAESTGGNIPVRSFEIKGIRVKVPTNYNPITRAYTGIWVGTFKTEWTDNPAWIVYDLLTNTRYGLGEFISPAHIDIGSFYAASQYNDELVPDGHDGQEPRFRFNYVINDRTDAIKVLQAVASTMRASVVYEGGLLRLNQDRPSDAVKLITNADVVDGMFNYVSTSRTNRRTVLNVGFNEQKDRYLRKTVTVEAGQSIKDKVGYIEGEEFAYGVVTDGQATRFGKWILETEHTAIETVTFGTSFQNFDLRLGDVIKIWDADYAGRPNGKIVSTSGQNITLDRSITIGSDAKIMIMKNDGKGYETYNLTQGAGTYSVVTAVETLQSHNPQRTFIIEDEVKAREFRVIAYKVTEKNIIEVTGAFHDNTKYSRIEQDLDIPAPVYSGIPPNIVNQVQNVTFRMSSFVDDEGVRRSLWIEWEDGPVIGDLPLYYSIQWRVNDGNFLTIDNIETRGYELRDVNDGTYDFIIRAHGRLGAVSTPVDATHTISLVGGSGSLLNPVTNLQLVNGGTTFDEINPTFEWVYPTSNQDIIDATLKDFAVIVLDASDNILRTEHVPAVEFGQKQTYAYTYEKNRDDGGPRRVFKVSIQCRDTTNKTSNSTTQTFTNPAPATPAITVNAGVGSLMIDVQPSNAPDYAGTLIWGSTTPGFTPAEGNLIYDGLAAFYIQDTSEQWYFRAAHYDTYGKVSLNVSTEGTNVPSTAAGIATGTSLPNSPADIGGELAFFLDSADPDLRGLYAWDGTQWQFTRDGANLIANSVTADKITVNNLAAITANMGSITSGSLTIDQSGFIQGGATAYGTGTGFWQGYHSGAYKWRVGTPGGSGAEWDGTTFKIYGPDGSVTLASGGSVGGYNSWTELIADTGQITSSNVSTVIANAGIGAAQIGSLALVGTNNFSVKTALSGARMEMDSQAIKVFDSNGVLRVQLGDLTV